MREMKVLDIYKNILELIEQSGGLFIIFFEKEISVFVKYTENIIEKEYFLELMWSRAMIGYYDIRAFPFSYIVF